MNIQNCVKIMLQEIGEDVTRDGLKETPTRFEKSFRFLCSGYQMNPKEILSKTFKEDHHEMVVLDHIEFYSLCEHHLSLFYGQVHIAYIPNGKVVGISKLARLVDCFARRLQVQERMCSQIVDSIEKYLKPQGVACIIEAKHTCISSRGCQKQNSVMRTSGMRGVFLKEVNARQEFLQLIKDNK